MLKRGNSNEWKDRKAIIANLGCFLRFELYFSFSLFRIQLCAVSLIELLPYSVDQ